MRRATISITVILLFVFLTLSPVVSAVAPDDLIKILDEEDGLIDNSITKLAHDPSNSLLYIGTPDGISVYDIVEETVILNKTYSDSSNDIVDICNAYNTGGVYLLTANQSYPVREIIEPSESDDFLNISFSGSPILTTIMHAQDNLLYIGSSENGIFEYDITMDELTQYELTHDNETFDNQISTMLIGHVVSSTDWLFVGTDNGVWVFDIDAKTFLNFGALETIGHPVQSLNFDNPSNELCVGTPEGLFIYSITETTADLETTLNVGELNDQNIQSLGMDSSLRQLYIGTSSELAKFDLRDHTLKQMSALAAELGYTQLTDRSVTAIVVDQTEDIVYVGTENGGIHVFAISYEPGLIELILGNMAFLMSIGLFTIIGIIVAILLARR